MKYTFNCSFKKLKHVLSGILLHTIGKTCSKQILTLKMVSRRAYLYLVIGKLKKYWYNKIMIRRNINNFFSYHKWIPLWTYKPIFISFPMLFPRYFYLDFWQFLKNLDGTRKSQFIITATLNTVNQTLHKDIVTKLLQNWGSTVHA